jgi:hypothetical protein
MTAKIECPGCEGTGDCAECNGEPLSGCDICSGTGECVECDGLCEIDEDDPEPPEPYYAQPPSWS